MKTVLTFVFVGILYIPTVWTQASTSYNITTIDSLLVKDANAVVRRDRMTITIEAVDRMYVRKQFALTVLNKKGEEYLHLSQFYDPETKIKKLEAHVYNKNGELIEKIKKSDFQDYAYAAGYTTVASDNRYKYAKYISNNFPYTIDFQVEYENSNTGFLPSFYFAGNYNVGIESSEFIFNNPTAIPFSHIEKNFDSYAINKEETTTTVSWKATSIPPISEEKNAPPASMLFPYVKLSLQDFTLVSVPAHVTDWKSMGVWQNENLLKGRRTLPESTLLEIENKLAGVRDTLEKAKIIYKYVQDKTRYVSVQLGIGGWQPMLAEDVDRLGYGDCKALTNYTKALLDSQGIPAYYSVIYGDKNIRNIDDNIVSLQGNHVILNIPNKPEDVWLECTSQTTPFGYIAGFTDDRKTLVITPEGGIIKKTKTYTPEDNYLRTKAEIHLLPSNILTAKLTRESAGIHYLQHRSVERAKDRKRYYQDDFHYINNVKVGETSFEDNLDTAVFTENIEATVDKFASRAGENFIIRPYAFGSTPRRKLKGKKRHFPIYIQRGYTIQDWYTYTIDSSFEFDEISEDVRKVTSVFGEYTFQLKKLGEHTFQLDRKLTVYPGEFANDQAEVYNQFYKKIRRIDNTQIIFKHKL